MTKLKQLVCTVVAATIVVGMTTGASLAKDKTCKALAVIDPDNDGSLDLAEAKKAAGAVFDRLNKDKDKDATLDRKELKGRLTAKDIAAADPDKDKSLDKAEYLAVVEARFKAANGDKDSTIECKELSTKAGRALLQLLK